MSPEQLGALAESLGGPPAPAPAARPDWKWKLGLAVVAGVILFCTGIGVGALIFRPNDDGEGGEKGDSALVLAKDKCSLSSANASVGDGGSSLTINGAGKEGFGLSYTNIECVLKELNTPDHVISEMSSTRALDGKQTAQWGKIRASWTYHPDQGLDLILVSE
ncbi:hypothetical protein OG559_19070 [Micromonospora sp. NBC_01405]|uniref:hypothetical protein n=1 Tax=Micromonospora sp. NBC_01405 TaxID=2903589 RepID=UPI00324DC0D5